ncbi:MULTISPECIES: fused MFS/spermidine synthase [Rhodomicrobium]|uniref:fused MFS/spermidine synthase n=1 Tax=Rhodomicrobium TaxID=1068 RepID=UPI000B4BA77A|nr:MULTISPECIES: fused MFS/spermidine synthase [Rhodomicrobium]
MSRPTSLPLLHALLCLSGFAGLGYEIVWARMLAVGLGHEIVAVLAVIAAFFSGLALGAYVLDRAIARTSYPGRWYAGLELAIGAWSLVLTSLIPLANRFAATLIGTDPSPVYHWTVAFALPFFILLPATFAMGGTLPAMERLRAQFARSGREVGGLYAANTFGAFAGTLLTMFLIVPQLGISGTLLVLAAANVLCAAAVLMIARRSETAATEPDAQGEAGTPAPRLWIMLFATGLIGIGYEVLAIRVLAHVMENTVYTFASALSVYLLGTALGAAAYQRFGRSWSVEGGLSGLLPAACAACLAGILALHAAPAVYDGLLSVFRRTFAGSVAAELGVAMLVFLPPTIVMGGLFSHLAQAARGLDGGLGRALAINTLGAAAAPLLFGVLLLPWAGPRLALVAVSLAYLLLLAPLPGLRFGLMPGLAATAALALALMPLDLSFVTAPQGGRIITHVDGVLASVSVVADARDERYLKVDNHFRMGSTASAFSDRRQSYLPLLLHPNPQRALFLGIGTGGTFAGAADFPGLRADGVELVPEILPLLRYFEPATGDLTRAPGLHLAVADARRYVQATPERYDVVIADLFHPARDGSGSLYTQEHFAAIRARLAEDGLFCQWLPLHQLDLETLAVIVRTFQSVFPDASAYLAHYSLQTPLLALIGGRKPLRVTADALERRLAEPALRQKLAALRLDTPYALLGTFAAGADDLHAFAGNGPLNTDDRPLVAFHAPSTVYRPMGPPSERLLALIDRFKPQPGQILGSTTSGDLTARLAAYWEARNQFLKAGIGVDPTQDIRKMVERVRQPLLAAVQKSPDFDPAYMPLLSLASALAGVDRDGARRLLTDLANANPAREEAKSLLRQLAPAHP